MTATATAFRYSVLTGGKHKGMKINQVDVGYLDWLYKERPSFLLPGQLEEIRRLLDIPSARPEPTLLERIQGNEATLPVGQIKIGKRHRVDLGDLEGLAHSIQEVGLLHPIVVTNDHQLIAGQRRLEACKKLHWEKVPVRILNLENILLGEYAENEHRKPFTPSEAVAIGRTLEEMERAKAKERQQQAGTHGRKGGRGKRRQKPFGKITRRVSVEDKSTATAPETATEPMAPDAKLAVKDAPEENRTRDKVASAVDMSGRTYEKAKAVVEAAEKEPKRYGDLVDKMDGSGKVDPAYQEMKQRAESTQMEDLRRKIADGYVPTAKDYKGLSKEEFWEVVNLSASEITGRRDPAKKKAAKERKEKEKEAAKERERQKNETVEFTITLWNSCPSDGKDTILRHIIKSDRTRVERLLRERK